MDKSFEVVVAIDFGTSCSGFAYKFKESDVSVFRDLWPDNPRSYPKTATYLLLSSTGEVEAWGYTAMKKLAQFRAQGTAKDYYFAHNFKMELHSGKKDESGPYIINKNNGEKIYVIDLIAKYIRLIKDEALKEIKNSTSGELKDQEIRWCLSIPAIWKDWETYLRGLKDFPDYFNWLLKTFYIPYSKHNDKQEKQRINAIKKALQDPKQLIPTFYLLYKKECVLSRFKYSDDKSQKNNSDLKNENYSNTSSIQTEKEELKQTINDLYQFSMKLRLI